MDRYAVVIRIASTLIIGAALFWFVPLDGILDVLSSSQPDMIWVAFSLMPVFLYVRIKKWFCLVKTPFADLTIIICGVWL